MTTLRDNIFNEKSWMCSLKIFLGRIFLLSHLLI